VEPHLSLILPVHNGAGYIADNLRTLLRGLEQLGEPFELIVVCDGICDATPELARAIADDRVRVLLYPDNRGKGFAIVHGFDHARGRLVGWLDSDLDVHPEAILAAAKVFDTEAVDAVIGSKRHPDSSVDYPAIRRVYSWGYQMLVRSLFRVNVRDTQVGAKLFRREVLEIVAPLLLIKRYAFDLELLAVGAEFGFDRVREVPVRIDKRFSGTLINRQAVYSMFVDTLAIAYRIHLKHWYVRRFASLQRQRMDHARSVPAPAGELGPPPMALLDRSG
jgi:glycosyltransferase involved in cell wall biosynthesis